MSSYIKVLSNLILSNDPSATELPTLPKYGTCAFKNGIPYIWSKVDGEDQWLRGSGQSAYEIAVKNGYVGDKVQWLRSLKGEKGDAFKIVHTYSSIDAMNNDLANIFPDGSFVLISNGPLDVDTGKVYTWDKQTLTFKYMFSLQGQAIQGDSGKSAYEIALEHGYMGTESSWLESLSAYGLAVKTGYIGTLTEWLASLKGTKGEAGTSAYQTAIDNGFVGTINQWLASLKGEAGKSTYETAVLNGFEGTPKEWLASLKGEQGIPGIQGIQGQKGDPFKIVKTYYRIEEMEADKGNLQPNVMVCVTDLDATSARIYWYDGVDFTYILNMRDTVVKGDDGKSAYDLAIEMNLFDGTPEEWILSLKGDEGITGKDAFEYWKELESKPEATIKEFLDYYRGADAGDTAIFSFTERKVNKVWATNKQMWRKVIDVGLLKDPTIPAPNVRNYIISKPHGISNAENIVSISGFAVKDNMVIPITYVTYGTTQNSVSCYYQNDLLNIKIYGIDLSLYSAFLIVEYTKTSDSKLSQAEIDALDDGRGEPGLSAYDIAVQYGEFKGSERDWLAALLKPALPKGGKMGELLVKQSDIDGIAGWQKIKLESRTYFYEQISASSEWVVVHNLNTTEFTYRIIASSGEEIIGDLDIVNANVIKISLTDPMSGQFQMIARTTESAPVQTRFVEVDQYSEKIFNIGKVNGDVNVLLSSGPIQYIEPDGDINIKFYDWASVGKSSGVTLAIKNNENVYSLSFADDIIWSYGIKPELTANSYVRFSVFSDDAGQIKFGFVVGNFNYGDLN